MGVRQIFKETADEFQQLDKQGVREIVQEVKPILIGVVLLIVSANLAIEAANLIPQTGFGGLLLLVVSFVPIGMGVAILRRALGNW